MPLFTFFKIIQLTRLQSLPTVSGPTPYVLKPLPWSGHGSGVIVNSLFFIHFFIKQKTLFFHRNVGGCTGSALLPLTPLLYCRSMQYSFDSAL